MLRWEKKAFLDGASIIIGLDEAGRGPLAGPVVAAAVVLKDKPLKKFSCPRYRERIDDSKKLLPSQRKRAYQEIYKRSIFGHGIKDNKFIDEKNILKAANKAMEDAANRAIRHYCRLNKKDINKIKNKICLLVDGNMDLKLPYKKVYIVKGDTKSFSIAAASIVAKVARDSIMDLFDRAYPCYGFLRHKGYGTRSHLEALEKHGPCNIHRKTFAPIKFYKDDDC